MPFDEVRARRQADPILAEFYGGTGCPTQEQIDFLVKRNGVPPLALARDSDGDGWPLGAARVVLDGDGLFEFADNEECHDLTAALVFVARDTNGDPLDLVSWAPRSDTVSSRFGRASVLGEQEVAAYRVEEPLTVHRSMIDWLRADRSGIVIVHPDRAWRCLVDETLAAANFEHGLDLRRALAPPRISILVPEPKVLAA